MGVILRDRENAVLSAFLFANDTHEDLSNAFLMDVDVFSTKLQKRIVEKLNEETKGDKMYGYQSITIESAIAKSPLLAEWIEILAQLPMPLSVAKRVYDDLEKEHRQRIARGLVC